MWEAGRGAGDLPTSVPVDQYNAFSKSLSLLPQRLRAAASQTKGPAYNVPNRIPRTFTKLFFFFFLVLHLEYVFW